MAWQTITEADLLTAISGPELTAVRNAALAQGQADPVQPAIDQVTRIVRSRVAACARNKLGAGNTIPDELLGYAVAMIIWKLPLRAAGLVIDEQDGRRQAHQEAVAALNQVAECKFAIEPPDTVSDEAVSAPSPSFNHRLRTHKRSDYDGS